MNISLNRHWLLLILSLPTENATLRMRIWRALKALGAVSLRDGAYITPRQSELDLALKALRDEVIETGGIGHVLESISADGAESATLQARFDRSDQFASLHAEISKAQASLAMQAPAALRRLSRNLQREFEAIASTDFFPGPAHQQTLQALETLQGTIQNLLSPGEPQAVSREIQGLDREQFQGRIWATRQHPGIDRLASAWLIGRFIDTDARFVWLRHPGDCPPAALGFDFDGATFTHVGARVTFEVLAESFGLQTDPALIRLGQLVHYLDVGGIPVPEAAGLEAILEGARRRCSGNDDALLEEAGRLFDFLYTSQGEENTPAQQEDIELGNADR